MEGARVRQVSRRQWWPEPGQGILEAELRMVRAAGPWPGCPRLQWLDGWGR